MKKDFLFKNLTDALQNRIPQRGKLADVLAELLGIEKEAVYRRLRGSVPFSFQEVYTIAIYLGFSLDSIAENISPVTRQMTVLMIEFLEPQESDYKKLESFSSSIHRLKDDPDSESGAIGSIIPSSLCVSYQYIYKFQLFKWSHQFGDPKKVKSYAETNASERLNHLNRNFVEGVQDSPKSVYILDRRFIEYFVNDIRFFFDVRLITKEDVSLLKEDLHLLLNDLERYATNGRFDSGNRVDIFLANVHFDANYNYIDATNYKLTMMRTFTFSDSYSFDEVVFQNMKNWLNFLKRTSTLISHGNVTERIRFFERQRKFINTL
ncbi:MAG: hypothetical protein FWF53_07325 [Candidatus Azobacteroides sp.]|nr:hypothetical protein [Candidatus Azobacteroides sp.]